MRFGLFLLLWLSLQAAAQRVLRNTDPAKTRELLARLNS